MYELQFRMQKQWLCVDYDDSGQKRLYATLDSALKAKQLWLSRRLPINVRIYRHER
jgi:hypothetical protein